MAYQKEIVQSIKTFVSKITSALRLSDPQKPSSEGQTEGSSFTSKPSVYILQPI